MDVLDTLRVKCPWDAKQTNESLRENTIEEVFELCDALIKGDNAEIRKELGDVLLHVFFRHPHVYGQVEADTAHKVEQNWEQLKLKEKDGNRSILAGVPGALPALIKAYRIQQKAANAGFDWEQPADVWAKVKEEIAEFSSEAEKFQGKESLTEEQRKRMEEEMGDVFFSLINAARLYGIHPDTALEHTNKKFISRFNHIEQRAKAMGKTLPEMTLAEMDALWDEAKQSETDRK